MVVGRSAYRAYLASWNELRQARHDLSLISAQDEFAKWARLQRKIDAMQSAFDQTRK